jgi:hypothetical protein
MATKKHTQPKRDFNQEFPGAMEEKFGNQYFEKQGTEHSSRPPYQHDAPRDVDSKEDRVVSSEHKKDTASANRTAGAPPYGKSSRKKRGMGNKDQYQGG